MLFSHKRRAPRHSGKQPRPRNARLRVETLEDRTTPYVLSGFKWSNPNLTFSFMPDGTPAEGATSTLFSLLNATIPTATWQREIARALQTWADSSTLNFRLVTDPNGDIRIGAVPQGGSLAYAYYPTGGDAYLATGFQFFAGADYDLYSVLLHEFGHSLGLRHSDVGDSVMAPTYGGIRTGLRPDDVAGIQAIYGARQADSYDAAGANNSLGSATAMTLSAGGLNFAADLTSMTDVDYYRVTASGSSLTVSVDARNRSLLAPKVLVYDASGTLVGSADGAYGQVATLTVGGLTAGQTYYLVADGSTADEFGMGAYGLTAQFSSPPAPAAPTNLSASAAGSTQVNLAWQDKSSTEDGFRVERSTDGVNFTFVANAAANATSYAVTGLAAGTTYYFRVRAFNGGGDSAWSNTAQATTPVAVPGAPSGVTATAASPTQINLAWQDNASNEDGFRVERSTDGATFTLVANVGANTISYAVTGLSANTTYYFRVRAYNAGGDSGWSNTAQATTPAAVPAAPSGLTATAAGPTQINLAWQDNASNEASFRIERSTDGVNFELVAIVPANATSFAVTGLTANTTYYFRVQALSAGGDSGCSNTAQATTPAAGPTAPDAPTNLSSTIGGPTQINLAWQDNASNEDGFRIERSTDGVNFTFVANAAANATSYAVTGLAAGTTYYFRVRAFNGGGDSAWSNTAQATTPVAVPAGPTVLSAAAAGPTQINVWWQDNASNEDGFRVERSTDGATFTLVANVGANTISYAVTGLSASTTYYFRVRAYNAGGDSGWSNTAQATTLPAAPAAPTGLVASPASATQINLAWQDNAGNEDGYRIERSTDGATFVLVANVGANATGYAVTGLTAGTTYYFRVRAYNGGGDSAWSTTAQATTPNAGLLPDRFEVNNTSATARNLGSLTSTAQPGLTIHNSSDQDYFLFTAKAAGRYTIQTNFGGGGNLDLVVYNSRMVPIGTGTLTGSGEAVTLSLTKSRRYYVKVTGVAGATNSYDLSIQKAAAIAPLMPVIPDGSGIRDYFFADGSCEEHEFDGGHHEQSHDGLTPPSPASVVHAALGLLPAVSADGIVSLVEPAGAAWSREDAFAGTDGTWPAAKPAEESPTVEWALVGAGRQAPTDSNPATPDVSRPALGEWLAL